MKCAKCSGDCKCSKAKKDKSFIEKIKTVSISSKATPTRKLK